MKKIQINIFTFIVILVFFCSISVYAGSFISAINVSFDNTKTTSSSTNVQEALDEIYDKTNYGDATSDDILSNKTALLNGQKVKGTMINNGAWTSTPTDSGKVLIPKGYHDGTGYVDTSAVYNAGKNSISGSDFFYTYAPVWTSANSTSTEWTQFSKSIKLYGNGSNVYFRVSTGYDNYSQGITASIDDEKNITITRSNSFTSDHISGGWGYLLVTDKIDFRKNVSGTWGDSGSTNVFSISDYPDYKNITIDNIFTDNWDIPSVNTSGILYISNYDSSTGEVTVKRQYKHYGDTTQSFDIVIKKF